MDIYRIGSYRNCGRDTIANIKRDPSLLGKGCDSQKSPVIQFCKKCCQIRNLNGHYDVFAELTIEDVLNAVKCLVSEAEESDSNIAAIIDQLSPYREELSKLVALSYGYIPAKLD